MYVLNQFFRVNPGGNPHAVPAGGRPTRFPSWNSGRTVLVLTFVALLISACQPLTRPALDATSPTVSTPDAEAPAYARRGPHWVGYRTLVSEENEARSLAISLWYPAQNPTEAAEEIEYAVQLKDDAWTPDEPPVTQGRALRDAAVDEANGPYPLVILSHGYILSPAWYSTLAEQIASFGFVVLAPDHVEQFDPAFDAMWQALIDRPHDVKQTLDFAERLSAADADMADLIDMEKVAVLGHSYGGYTALAMAGARIDFAAYEERCAAIAEDDPLAFFCTPLLTRGPEMARRAGFEAMPEGLWPSLGDPRVTAIITMAGDSYLFDEAGLSQISVPVMAIAGSADTGTPLAWGALPTYDHASSEQKALVTLAGAEHMIFTTPCERQPWLNEHPYAAYFCSDPAWNRDQALDLIHHFATAFLLDVLKADPAAREVLLPDAVQFPGVEYVTTLR